jgi:uncharacterized pyridoxamine 5'-phosphate oxidase family protein
MKKILVIVLGVLLVISLTVNGILLGKIISDKKKNDSLEFFKSLDYDDGLSVIVSIFNHFPMQYATYKGTDSDSTPEIKPIEFKFEQDGKLYFDTVKFYASYAQLQAYPYIEICIGDQQTMTYLTIKGKVNFTEDEEIINKCFENSPVLTSQYGNNRSVVIAYYLSEVTATFSTFSTELKNHTYYLD